MRRYSVVAILFCLAVVLVCGCRSRSDYDGPVVVVNASSDELWPILKQFVEDNYGLATADKEKYVIESAWSKAVEREGAEFSRRVILRHAPRASIQADDVLIDVEVQVRSRKSAQAAWRNAGRDYEAGNRIIAILKTLLR